MSISKSAQPDQSVSEDGALDTEQPASLDAGIQGALGRRLRESYSEVVREAVPDKFLLLLDQLKKSEKDKAGEA